MGRLFQELKRRNVFRMAVLYVIAAWLVMQVAEVVVTLGALPGWIGQAVLLVLAVGFPIALIFSWFYELTPEGISLERDVGPDESITHITGRRMDFIVIAILCAAVMVFAYDKWWIPAPVDRSIAVLPFANMSDDPEQEYFSDGISEEILNLLANVPEMQVISRSSAFSFKGQNLDVPTMATRLNVAHVLEGSVRKSGNQLRITAQLIEAKTDSHLWSETYDRKLEDVFAVQDEIAASVVKALKITLLGDEPKSAETDPEVYALYLQARHFMNQVTPETNKQAETLLEQALEIDPGFAPAWTRLGNVFRIQANSFGLRPIHEGNEMARHAIQKALAIDPQYGPAYGSLASIEMNYDWDFVAADEHLRQARALSPGDFFILLTVAELSGTLGRIDEAIDLYSQAVALDPVSVFGHAFLAGSYYSAHRLDEAAESIQLAISLNPSAYGIHSLLSLVLLAQGDATAALAALEQENWHVFRLFGTVVVQHALGDEAASDAAFQELLECCAAGGEYQVAELYAFRGEIDNAFHWLDQAYANRDPGLTNMLSSRLLASLHDDPRWEVLLDKMGLPH